MKKGSIGKPSKPLPIPILEQERSVSMDPGHEAYGQPIAAQLGVYLIKNLFDRLNDNGLLEILTNGSAPPPDFHDADFVKGLYGWVVQLLWQSRAITIDKNIILKILSQPKAEGVRFYLCLTPEESKSSKKMGPDNPFPGTLSFVTVGVDLKGQDLNYEYKESKLRAFNDIPDPGTTSVVGEYGHPPGNGPEVDIRKETRVHYVLWKYAMRQHEKDKKKAKAS